MLGRFAALTLLFLFAADAHAHRLSADADYRLVRKVKVASYFSDDTRPKGALVQVYHPGEEKPFLEDHLDAEGELEFVADLQPLRVVVNAGEGHVKEVLIPAAETTNAATVHIPSSDPPVRNELREMVLGLGVLLGVAGFVLSVWNYRQLRKKV